MIADLLITVSASADGCHEMDFTSGRHVLPKAFFRYFRINGDGQAGSQSIAIDQPVSNPRVDRFQIVDYLPDSRSLDFNRLMPTDKRLHQGWYPDDGHILSSIAAVGLPPGLQDAIGGHG